MKKRAILLISSFSVLAILALLSGYAHGQNKTKDEELSVEGSFTIIHYFIATVLLVTGAAVGVAFGINRQINNSRKEIEHHTDTKIRELKDDLMNQIDKGEERIRFMERIALIKSLSEIEEVKRELLGTNKK